MYKVTIDLLEHNFAKLFAWLYENFEPNTFTWEIKQTPEYPRNMHKIVFSFKTEEQAVLFKLTCI